jgi:hypothetical protein
VGLVVASAISSSTDPAAETSAAERSSKHVGGCHCVSLGRKTPGSYPDREDSDENRFVVTARLPQYNPFPAVQPSVPAGTGLRSPSSPLLWPARCLDCSGHKPIGLLLQPPNQHWAPLLFATRRVLEGLFRVGGNAGQKCVSLLSR